MIFKLLDAYEQEIEKEYSFGEKIKRLATWKKVMFAIMIVAWIGFVPILFWTSNSAILISYMIVCTVLCLGVEELLKVDRRKKYVENLKAYNERLDKLKIVLKEKFAIDSATKLETIIKRCNDYLEQVKNNELDKKQSREQVSTNIVIPLGAFMLGKLASEMNSMEVVAYGIVLLIILFCVRLSAVQIIESVKTIYETTPMKMKYLVDELQDIYDRDYIN